MISKRCRRKRDPFTLVLILVALGMSVTLAYQLNVYHGADRIPMAEQVPSAPIVGG